MGEGECQGPIEGQPKKSRHRKKHLYNRILQQMEFYFSDSNLSKDRFLSQLLSQSSEIDIEQFLIFNKIRKLKCSKEDIQKALKPSKLIGISEDGTKLYRKTPLNIKENVDCCTIYVENIKPDATHEVLSQIFSDFGRVAYISIPKYKYNKTNKGFAFIEYETEDEAKEAISFFNSIGCQIPLDKNPEELQSILTFEGNTNEATEDNTKIKLENIESGIENNANGVKRKLSVEEVKDNHKKQKVDEEGNEKINEEDEKSGKRKIRFEEQQEIKRQKISEVEVIADVKPERPEESEVKPEESEVKLEESKVKPEESEVKLEESKVKPEESEVKPEESKVKPEESEDIKKKKKSKKDKRRNYIKELGLQVLSKKDWKKLRNHYLDLQRKKMSEFKQYLKRQKYSQKNADKNTETTEHIIKDEVKSEVAKLSYTPGVIVKVKLPDPCSDPKKLRNEIKALTSEVKYVDIPLPFGSEEVFVRLNNSQAAIDFCTLNLNGDKIILNGDEERNYWDKIENDRMVKFNKEAKKQRGRDKLLKKAEKLATKHLRFDENEETL
ncbi:hypothetical protein ABEB36_000753 [Hypothenemus hampei]|uniref:Uncharacterized protein n=1 Tax=Hypothenemus hampei TaxID=57062 RepID=A0ABD1FCE3_HYPHA